MKIPNPYFRNVGSIGDLVLEHMIFEAEYPVLFICKDNLDKKYICVCCDIRRTQRWIVSPISNVDLIKMLSDELTLRDAFLTKKSENSYLIEWNPQYPDTETVTPVSVSEIPDKDLPTVGEYIEAEEGEYDNIIALLNNEVILRKSVSKKYWNSVKTEMVEYDNYLNAYEVDPFKTTSISIPFMNACFHIGEVIVGFFNIENEKNIELSIDEEKNFDHDLMKKRKDFVYAG